ncbi:MAG: ROK family protein [Clostridia bacterium]|nr:ROK family protein [Clostridia bacterium]
MYYIGVDLGGTNIAIGICDKELNIIAKGSVPTNPDRAPELIVKDMADLSAKLLKEKNIPLDEVASVGIATPGTANSDTGVVEYSNNIPFFRFPIADVFKSFLPVNRVLIENDANAAALAEAIAGAAKGTKKSVMITLGTGVGGGIVIDGKVYSGFNHAAGELGHTVIEFNGRPCSCGRRGCWEAYSSATGLINMTREKVNECKIKGIPSLMVDEFDATGRVSARTAFSAMKKGDKVGADVVNEYIAYLACGITNMINIFQPEVLSIGGGICGEGDNLLKPLLEIVKTEQYTRKSPAKCEVKIAKLGNDAGIIGAAGLGL